MGRELGQTGAHLLKLIMHLPDSPVASVMTVSPTAQGTVHAHILRTNLFYHMKVFIELKFRGPKPEGDKGGWGFALRNPDPTRALLPTPPTLTPF